MLEMTARIQETPPDHKGGYDLAVDELHANAASYEDAYADVESRVPDGWRLISVRVDRG